MVDIEVHPLLLHVIAIVESNVLIFRALRVRVDGVSFDLPQRHPHVVGQHERHPVVIDKDVVRAGEVIGAHLQEKLSRNQTVVSMNEMNL